MESNDRRRRVCCRDREIHLVATSDTEVCNLGLIHIGVTKLITTLASETSTEAAACRTVYDAAVKTTLREFAWPFANKSADLGLVIADPDDYWGFSYQYPADCVNLLKLWSGIRNDSRQSRVPYKIANVSGVKQIFTDLADARMNYTKFEADVSLWPEDFTLSVSYKIGYMVSPPLTKGDPFKVGDKAQQNYMLTVSAAKANALNEEQVEEDVDSEFIRVRE